MTDRITATVKVWNEGPGWGFLTRDAGGPDLFLHWRALPRRMPRPLKMGTRIECSVVETERGPQAAAVAAIDAPPADPYRAPAA